MPANMEKLRGMPFTGNLLGELKFFTFLRNYSHMQGRGSRSNTLDGE